MVLGVLRLHTVSYSAYLICKLRFRYNVSPPAKQISGKIALVIISVNIHLLLTLCSSWTFLGGGEGDMLIILTNPADFHNDLLAFPSETSYQSQSWGRESKILTHFAQYTTKKIPVQK